MHIYKKYIYVIFWSLEKWLSSSLRLEEIYFEAQQHELRQEVKAKEQSVKDRQEEKRLAEEAWKHTSISCWPAGLGNEDGK